MKGTMINDAEHPWLEPDHLYEGVGAHRDNPRFDLATALADEANKEPPDAAP